MTNINKTPHTHPRADTETRMDSGTGMRRDAAGNPQHDTNPSAGGMGRSASFDVSGCETIGSLVHDLLERIDEIQQGKRDSVPTGFRDIDSAIQGLWPGQLALIAGRPGMGESALGLDFARAAALRHHMPTVVFSSTMSPAELAQRVVSAGTDIPMMTLNHGRYLDGVTDERWNRLNGFWEMTRDAPLFIRANVTGTAEIGEECRLLKRDHDLKLVVVDPLPTPTPTPDETAPAQPGREVSKAAAALKLLADELDVAVVSTLRMDDGHEPRDDRSPRLSNLHRFGSAVRDADVVFLVHRPEIHDPWRHPDTADIIMAKNNNGPAMTFHLGVRDATSKFIDLPEEPEPEEPDPEEGLGSWPMTLYTANQDAKSRTTDAA